MAPGPSAALNEATAVLRSARGAAVRTRNATLAVAGALLAVSPVSLVVLGGASFSEGVTVPVRVPSSAAVVDDAGSTVPAHPRTQRPRHPAPQHRRHHDQAEQRA